ENHHHSQEIFPCLHAEIPFNRSWTMGPSFPRVQGPLLEAIYTKTRQQQRQLLGAVVSQTHPCGSLAQRCWLFQFCLNGLSDRAVSVATDCDAKLDAPQLIRKRVE
ncbi:unnamed protein product, partial [Ectocarpus sp. 4 AP-2014]